MAKENELLIPVKAKEGAKKGKPYIALQVSYSKGGMSFATYRTSPRGIYISASPITIEDTDVPGLVVRSFMMFSGVRQLVEESKRLNQKRVAVLFAEAVADYKAKRGPAYALVLHVVEKNGLELEEEPALVPA